LFDLQDDRLPVEQHYRMSEVMVRFPVRCPVCSSESLMQFPVRIVSIILVELRCLQLFATCHRQYWGASDNEMQQIREYFELVYLPILAI